METIYLNTRQYGKVETLDEFTKEQNQSPKEFNRFVNDMIAEYSLAGMSVYKSSRSTKDWANK